MNNPADPASPYLRLERADWRRLRDAASPQLTDADLDRIRGLGDPVDRAEVADIYLPLSRLLNLHVRANAKLHAAMSTFLGEATPRTPFVIGLAGSVAVGKSTIARLLRELLALWPDHPQVEVVTTDGFLWPLAELERRGLMQRKGFPESYDQRALVRFVAAVKAGVTVVRAPVYSHLTYDIVPGQWLTVRQPDILVIEGLNVLQPPRARATGQLGLAVSDFFDFAIYVDAATDDVRRWYVERFLLLRRTAFADPRSYFHRYAALSDDEAVTTAERIWREINEPNLVANILPTRGRATLILHKGGDHKVQHVWLRKL